MQNMDSIFACNLAFDLCILHIRCPCDLHLLVSVLMPCRFVPKPTFISLCRFFAPNLGLFLVLRRIFPSVGAGPMGAAGDVRRLVGTYWRLGYSGLGFRVWGLGFRVLQGGLQRFQGLGL